MLAVSSSKAWPAAIASAEQHADHTVQQTMKKALGPARWLNTYTAEMVAVSFCRPQLYLTPCKVTTPDKNTKRGKLSVASTSFPAVSCPCAHTWPTLLWSTRFAGWHKQGMFCSPPDGMTDRSWQAAPWATWPWYHWENIFLVNSRCYLSRSCCVTLCCWKVPSLIKSEGKIPLRLMLTLRQ